MSLQALLAALFWGASFPAAKIFLSEAGPLSLLVLRHAIAGGLLLTMAAGSDGLVRVRRGDLGHFALHSVLLTVFHQGVLCYGLARATATNSGWLMATAPVFIALFAWLFLAERLRVRQWVGMAAGLTGSFFVVTQGHLDLGVFLTSGGLGGLMVLESAAAWGAYTVAGKGLLMRYPPIVVSAYGMAAGVAAAIPVWVAAGGTADLGRLTIRGWTGILYLGVCSTALAYVLFYRAMRKLPAGVAGAYMFLQPLEATLLGRLLLGEPFTGPTIVGGLMILGGVYLVTWPSRYSLAARSKPEGAT